MMTLTQQIKVSLIQAKPSDVEGKKYLSVVAAQPSPSGNVYGWEIMKASADPSLGPKFADIFATGCPVDVTLDVEFRQGAANAMKLFVVGVSPINKPSGSKPAAA